MALDGSTVKVRQVFHVWYSPWYSGHGAFLLMWVIVQQPQALHVIPMYSSKEACETNPPYQHWVVLREVFWAMEFLVGKDLVCESNSPLTKTRHHDNEILQNGGATPSSKYCSCVRFGLTFWIVLGFESPYWQIALMSIGWLSRPCTGWPKYHSRVGNNSHHAYGKYASSTIAVPEEPKEQFL